MQFTRIPPPFAPLGGPIGYTVENDTAAACDIRIIDPADGSLFGAKRFVSVLQAAFDAAPYLRAAVRFTPSAGPTGVYPATGRSVTAIVEAAAAQAGYAAAVLGKTAPDGMSETETTASEAAGFSGRDASRQNTINGSSDTCEPSERGASDPGSLDGQSSDQDTSDKNAITGLSDTCEPSERDASDPGSPEQESSGTVTPTIRSEQTATAPARTFLPTAEPAAAPTLLTTLPAVRLLPDGSSEELTLLTDAAQLVTVIARSGDTTTAASYSVPEAGMHLFRIDARDFPGAETLTVDAEACGAVDYTLVAPPGGSVRLAWRSSAGSLEHYTFPTETEAVVETVKTRAYGPDGYVQTGEPEWRRTLRSAFEVRPVLEALAELTCSPAVWLVTAEGYEPVEVVSEDGVVHRHGTMSCLEITIRPARKTLMPWN